MTHWSLTSNGTSHSLTNPKQCSKSLKKCGTLVFFDSPNGPWSNKEMLQDSSPTENDEFFVFVLVFMSYYKYMFWQNWLSKNNVGVLLGPCDGIV